MKTLLASISDDELDSLVDRAGSLAAKGECCPRSCKSDRRHIPPCGAHPDGIQVVAFHPHMGEEPPVSGTRGAGNVFFSGCTLSCVFCQNFPFSHLHNGTIYPTEAFCEKIGGLLARGVHNLNFTTFDHYLFPLLKALRMMKNEINVPISNNCSGYFRADTLDIVMSFCDIFLYDVKYDSEALAGKYSSGKNYVAHCWEGIDSFAKNRIPWIEEDGLLKRGVIFRHLVLPGAVSNTVAVLERLARIRDRWDDFRVSLMSQYFPAYRTNEFPEIDRRLEADEYIEALDAFERLGFIGWVQDIEGEGSC
jgi:putative pyruvate formate lyase activating enzyme